MVPKLPMSAVLEACDSHIVTEELARRVEYTAGRVQNGSSPNKDSAKWIGQHKKLANAKKLPWPIPSEDTKISSNPWFSNLSAREQEILLIYEDEYEPLSGI